MKVIGAGLPRTATLSQQIAPLRSLMGHISNPKVSAEIAALRRERGRLRRT